jgi:hypothetical protein
MKRRAIKPANDRHHNHSCLCECVYLPRVRRQTTSLLMLYVLLNKCRLRAEYHSHLCLTLLRVCYCQIMTKITTSFLEKSLDAILNIRWGPEVPYTKYR